MKSDIEKISNDEKLLNTNKSVDCLIKCVEHRQGPLQSYDIIIRNPEKYQEKSLLLPIWINFIYQGVHAIAEEEERLYQHEVRNFTPSYPVDFLECQTYNHEYQLQPVIDKWKRTPVAKRVNYKSNNPDLSDLDDENELIKVIQGHSQEINPENFIRVKIITVSRGVIHTGARLFRCSSEHLDKLSLSETPESLILSDVKYNGPIFSKEKIIDQERQDQFAGFVTSAWFSQKRGRSVAIGFVKNDLLRSMENGNLLLKNANSLQMYHVKVETYSEIEVKDLYVH